MSVERTLYCDGPECVKHQSTATPPPYAPPGWIVAMEWTPAGQSTERHFCDWDCAMKYGATREQTEVIPWGEERT